jgi:hypothetical protein
LLRNRLSGNGHNLALRQKPVPHKTPAALVVQKVDVTCHEFRHLRAHSRRQKLLRTRTQKIRQGSGEKSLGFAKSITVFLVMWHILFSMRIAARQQRYHMPAIRAVTNCRL